MKSATAAVCRLRRKLAFAGIGARTTGYRSFIAGSQRLPAVMGKAGSPVRFPPAELRQGGGALANINLSLKWLKSEKITCINERAMRESIKTGGME